MITQFVISVIMLVVVAMIMPDVILITQQVEAHASNCLCTSTKDLNRQVLKSTICIPKRETVISKQAAP